MKLFLDDANLDEITYAYSSGIIDGITTNPSLMKKAAERLKEPRLDTYIKSILTIAKGTPVSLEVVGLTYEDMIREGRILYKKFNKIAKNVYVKIPINPVFNKSTTHFDGIKAIRTLSQEGIPINCTLVFTPEQALLAAKAGALFVSPFAGRIDDLLRDRKKLKYNKSDYYPYEGLSSLDDNGVVSGVALIAQCVQIFKTHNLSAQVLAASIRNARQLREVALAGAHIATVPYDVLLTLVQHQKTEEGMLNFTKDVVPSYAELLKP